MNTSDLLAEKYDGLLLRSFDVCIASAALLLIAPLLLVLAILVRLSDGGPALFGQTRIGRDGRPFRCLKFRSMAVDSEARLKLLLATDKAAQQEWGRSQKLRDDPRITPLGAFLRRSSLDELPQLINVVRGEMSLVGPRPIVRDEIARYGAHFSTYCLVRPGITGLWQISGRSDVDYQRRVALDILYTRRRGPMLYMRILFMTIPAVMLSRGAV